MHMIVLVFVGLERIVFFLLIQQEFEDSRDAEDAIDELDGKELLGER